MVASSRLSFSLTGDGASSSLRLSKSLRAFGNQKIRTRVSILKHLQVLSGLGRSVDFWNGDFAALVAIVWTILPIHLPDLIIVLTARTCTRGVSSRIQARVMVKRNSGIRMLRTEDEATTAAVVTTIEEVELYFAGSEVAHCGGSIGL